MVKLIPDIFQASGFGECQCHSTATNAIEFVAGRACFEWATRTFDGSTRYFSGLAGFYGSFSRNFESFMRVALIKQAQAAIENIAKSTLEPISRRNHRPALRASLCDFIDQTELVRA